MSKHPFIDNSYNLVLNLNQNGIGVSPSKEGMRLKHSQLTPKKISECKGEKRVLHGDRFIPSRRRDSFGLERLKLDPNGLNSSSRDHITSAEENYSSRLAADFLNLSGKDEKILSCSSRRVKSRSPTMSEEEHQSKKYCHSRRKNSIPKTPERILDAPGLLSNPSLSLLSWSSKDVLAVALGPCVHLLEMTTNCAEVLFDLSGHDTYVSGVSWAPDGMHLAVGLSSGEINVWDTVQRQLMSRVTSHCPAIAALNWNGNMLTSGCREGHIQNYDIRLRQPVTIQAEDVHSGHGLLALRWSFTGQQLASGGGDSVVNIFDIRKVHVGDCVSRLGIHGSPISALAWCPLQWNVLASSGGPAVKFWNVNSGQCLRELRGNSEVSGFAWSQSDYEFLTCHSQQPQAHMQLWNYPTMAKMAHIEAHRLSVTQLCSSPDGSMTVTGGDDETICFWRVFRAGLSGRKASPVSDAFGVQLR